VADGRDDKCARPRKDGRIGLSSLFSECHMLKFLVAASAVVASLFVFVRIRFRSARGTSVDVEIGLRSWTRRDGRPRDDDAPSDQT
jgi:hypothetical protein